MDESVIREQEAQLQKTGRYYKHICFMAVPVLCMACFLYGVRPVSYTHLFSTPTRMVPPAGVNLMALSSRLYTT